MLGVVERDALDFGAGDDRAEDVDGIAGIGDGDGVLIVEHGEAEVGDALLGADGDDGFGFGIEVDVVAALVPVADGLAQAGQAAGERVAMGRGLLRGLDELVDDVLRSGAVGVAHAEVDDVFAALAGGGFQFTCDVEYVRGQPRQPSELFHACPVQSLLQLLRMTGMSVELHGAHEQLRASHSAPALLLCGKQDLHRQRARRVAGCVVARLVFQRAIHCMLAGGGHDGQLDGEGAGVDVDLLRWGRS